MLFPSGCARGEAVGVTWGSLQAAGMRLSPMLAKIKKIRKTTKNFNHTANIIYTVVFHDTVYNFSERPSNVQRVPVCDNAVEGSAKHP